MTAGAQEDPETETYMAREVNISQGSLRENKEVTVAKTAQDVWVETQNASSILPLNSNPGSSSSATKISTCRTTCDLPSLHFLREQRHSSLPPPSSHDAVEATKENWSSVPPDKSIDLIELMEGGMEAPRCSKCTNKAQEPMELGGGGSVSTISGASLMDTKLPRCNSATGDLEAFHSAPNCPEDQDFRMRSFSLTPTVNLAIFETESSSDDDDPQSSNTFLSRSDEHNPANNFYLPTVSAPLLSQTISCSPSAAQLSLASSVTDNGAATCKICHMTSKDGDPLISPCRCSGTMQFIHCGCLMRWLEISSKKSRKPPSCELCQYQYHWHKKFKVRHWQFPHCSRHDKILHVLFFISVMIMIACATITIMCFKQDKGTKVDPDRTELTESEIVTLVCGVLFFLAFFVAMYVEVKARNTIYKLVVRFVYLNQQWYIDEYEKKESAPVSV